MILHIPHSSTVIPEKYKSQFLLDSSRLHHEKLLMTDARTDKLFSFYSEAKSVIFPYSRLLVDVERFEDDAQESMAAVGMGMIYSKTAHGEQLRRTLSHHEHLELLDIYQDHHKKLEMKVNEELDNHGHSLIIDCHSFPSAPLPCDTSQKVPRPDICLGIDEDHTPTKLIDALMDVFRKGQFTVAINEPYAGTIVPLRYYKQQKEVCSIMIELNRKLYIVNFPIFSPLN